MPVAVPMLSMLGQDVHPNFDAVGARSTLVTIVGALLTVVLVVAVLMLVVCAVVWAVAAASGNYQGAAHARAGVLVALGAAALSGAGVAWVNFLLDVGASL